MNLNVSVCYESGQPCAVVIPVFENTALPKETCNRDQDFLDSCKFYIKIIDNDLNFFLLFKNLFIRFLLVSTVTLIMFS